VITLLWILNQNILFSGVSESVSD